ncbi:MAG TPA: transporter [Candidatus Polarisedimenticolia bacterium]|nr:transporter [Candidatus Polarisedimenticolia bacterium]
MRPAPRFRLAATVAVVAATVWLAAPAARAQDMEPRAYSSAPIGTNFIAVGAGNTRGALLFDPALPIEDAQADLNLGTFGYARTFALAGKQGLVSGGLIYGRGELKGLLSGVERVSGRSGLTDLRVRVSLNLLGPGVLTPAEYAKAPHRTILGVSLAVQAPTGQYDPDRLINLGTNRWAFKPEIGVSVPVDRWFLDAYAGVVFFTDNDEFFPGDTTRRQDPLGTIQAHASYTFRTRAWLAFDATWYGGGDSTVDDGEPAGRQNSSRFGGTASFPIARGQSLKLAASTGAWVQTGSDFTTGTLTWQFTWFDPSKRPGGTGKAP